MSPTNNGRPGAVSTRAAKGFHPEGTHRRQPVTAFELAWCLDPTSIVLHDHASFDCPRCRTARGAFPVGVDRWRCAACQVDGNAFRLRGMVRADRRAAERLAQLHGLQGAA